MHLLRLLLHPLVTSYTIRVASTIVCLNQLCIATSSILNPFTPSDPRYLLSPRCRDFFARVVLSSQQLVILSACTFRRLPLWHLLSYL